VKRLPHKRGFTNIFKTEFELINVGSLNAFAPETVVTPEELHKARLIKTIKKPVKILGNGQMDHALVIRAAKFSKVAKEKIEAAGGQAETI
jgi:large subunit ribosomal protein L15